MEELATFLRPPGLYLCPLFPVSHHVRDGHGVSVPVALVLGVQYPRPSLPVLNAHLRQSSV